jgi:hypothetical protein
MSPIFPSKSVFGLLAKLKGELMEQDLLVAASLIRAPKPRSIFLGEAVNMNTLLVAGGLRAIGVRLGISDAGSCFLGREPGRK